MRILVLASVLTVTAPALAGAPAPSGGSQSDGPVELYNALDAAADRAQEAFGPDETCQRNLDLPAVVVPVVEDHRLAGYAYVVPRICLSRGGPLNHSGRLHYLTDRFVRAAHRSPFELTSEGGLSRDSTHAAMLEAAGEFIAPADIDRLDLLGEDIRYLR